MSTSTLESAHEEYTAASRVLRETVKLNYPIGTRVECRAGLCRRVRGVVEGHSMFNLIIVLEDKTVIHRHFSAVTVMK